MEKESSPWSATIALVLIGTVGCGGLALFGVEINANQQSQNRFVQLMNKDARIILAEIKCTLTAGIYCKK